MSDNTVPFPAPPGAATSAAAQPAQADQPPAAAAPTPPDRPRHVAVIMDGNGRWARARGLPRAAGHRRGVDAVRNISQLFGRRGIPYLTLFAFSSENWRRPAAEVELLLRLLATTLEKELSRLHDNDIRLRVIGDLARLPAALRRRIDAATELTRANRAFHLTIAVNYGGRWDVTQACRSVAESVARGALAPADVTPALVESRLCTRDLPAPDLFIRTGGERRISNFLLWQLAYTELCFIDAYWPDFDASHFDRALEIYARRQRRFGQTGEQVQELAAAFSAELPAELPTERPA